MIDEMSHRQEAIQRESEAVQLEASVLEIRRNNNLKSLAGLWNDNGESAVTKEQEKLRG